MKPVNWHYFTIHYTCCSVPRSMLGSGTSPAQTGLATFFKDEADKDIQLAQEELATKQLRAITRPITFHYFPVQYKQCSMV